MNVTIVDYNSGNISSVINSFNEVANNKVNIEVTSNLNKIKSSDKVVLPGQGSFKSCVDALNNINGLADTLNEFANNNKKPLLGICVGRDDAGRRRASGRLSHPAPTRLQVHMMRTCTCVRARASEKHRWNTGRIQDTALH